MRIKRLLALLLCVVLTFALCACGNSKKEKERINMVQKELIGAYLGSNAHFARKITFNADGTYSEFYISGIGRLSDEGTWKIEKDTIILERYGDGLISEYTYEYDESSGKLTLYRGDLPEPYNKVED